jgi:hypothetical protein
MLHQRTTRRQGLPGEIDPNDPTTTVYGSGGGTNSGQTGYGGYGGNVTNNSPYGGYGNASSYGSSNSLNNNSAYNGKGKKKKPLNILKKIQDPLFIVSGIAFICFMFAVRYKLAHQHIHRDIHGEVHSISRQRDELQRELKTIKESHKRQTLDAKKFQTELMKMKNTHLDKMDPQKLLASSEAITKMENRDKAWKQQYDVLKESVVKESRRSVIDK